MYAGHAALATLAKSFRVRVPMALLVPVAFAPDWIEWLCDAAGYGNREISHSLVAVGIGACLTSLVYYLVTREPTDCLLYTSPSPRDS